MLKSSGWGGVGGVGGPQDYCVSPSPGLGLDNILNYVWKLSIMYDPLQPVLFLGGHCVVTNLCAFRNVRKI